MRTGRVRESGTAGLDFRRKRKPLTMQTQAARTTRAMEPRRRCCQVVAVTKKAAFMRYQRERMLRRKENALPRSRSMCGASGRRESPEEISIARWRMGGRARSVLVELQCLDGIEEGFFPRKARKGAEVLTSRTSFGRTSFFLLIEES